MEEAGVATGTLMTKFWVARLQGRFVLFQYCILESSSSTQTPKEPLSIEPSTRS